MQKSSQAEPTKLAVRKVVDLILRCGDIDSGFNDSSAMYKGAALHRKIQKESGENYQKEVSLKLELEIEGIPTILQGRADGIIRGAEGELIVDEIKTTTLPLDIIFKQHKQHLGQGMCYAYMYMQTLEHPPDSISVQLTYYQIDNDEIKRHKWEFSSREIDEFFTDLIRKYGMWLRFEREWRILRDTAIAEAPFPFESYRKGQRELAVAAYRSICARKNLYVSAPTGIGKTLSALFPSIKAMGTGEAEKLFYLTAKTVTRAVAEDAIELMAKKGLRFKLVTLRAKEKICLNMECICSPGNCAYAKGHYDRVNDALWDILNNNDLITPAITEEYAKKHFVCPYELTLDAALYCDLVIGDYNHVFDPTVYLRRFFSDNENSDYLFLIDEAHNLSERVRDMYTVTLRKGSFSNIRNRLKDKDEASKKLRKTLRQINSYLVDMHKKYEEYGEYVNKEADTAFNLMISLIFTALEEWFAAKKNETHELFSEILNLYFDVAKFLMISEIYDDFYTTVTEIKGSDVCITLFCLDPSSIIKSKLALSKSSILFSATLTPLKFYHSILGGSDSDNILSLPSPFDPNRLLTITHCGISTKYADRENSYAPIAEAIFTAVCHKKGNYLVFFPSYDYLRRVYELFSECYPNIKTLVQQNVMSDDERADFLKRFSKDNRETLAGFAVLGGIFSEGIDLKGDRLIGSIIVSVGLPKISLRQNQIMDYYEKKNGQGYDFAYTYPGMNKVLQAAGRVIRCESDSGVVILIDSRYMALNYRKLLPEYWNNVHVIRSNAEFEALIEAKLPGDK